MLDGAPGPMSMSGDKVACTKPSYGDCFVIDSTIHKTITNRRLGTG